MGNFLQSVLAGVEMARQREQDRRILAQQTLENTFRQQQFGEQQRQFNESQSLTRRGLDESERARQAAEAFQAAQGVSSGAFSTTPTTAPLRTDPSLPQGVGVIDTPQRGFSLGGVELFPTSPQSRAEIETNVALDRREKELQLQQNFIQKEQARILDDLTKNPVFKSLPEHVQNNVTISQLTGKPFQFDPTDLNQVLFDFYSSNTPASKKKDLQGILQYHTRLKQLSASNFNPNTQVDFAADSLASQAIQQTILDLRTRGIPNPTNKQVQEGAVAFLQSLPPDNPIRQAAVQPAINKVYMTYPRGAKGGLSELIENMQSQANRPTEQPPQPIQQPIVQQPIVPTQPQPKPSKSKSKSEQFLEQFNIRQLK